jgi:hypothetical protein
MKFASLAALSLAASAHGEILWRLSDDLWVWNGGLAADMGQGWIGWGWEEFPGVSPPWNPVVPAVPPPPVVVMPAVPAPCFPPMPAPQPRQIPYIRIGDQLIPQVPSW